MSDPAPEIPSEAAAAVSPNDGPHKRRARYAGKYPRRFEDRYKERNPERFPETVEKVLASGKTPAGMHRPIMPVEIAEALQLQPGMLVIDCTLGFGGHAEQLIPRILPGGRYLGIDADPIELPKTEARLRTMGFGDATGVFRSNFAGISKVIQEAGGRLPDAILADLGVSSMQIDDPARGFSIKADGPLDMRMNPNRGQSAAEYLRKIEAAKLARALSENSDEPHAELLAAALAGREFPSTRALRLAIELALEKKKPEAREESARRVFQAIRIEVNDEFSALETLLRAAPQQLQPAGRIAILTFHSGEDRRVKKAFESGLHTGEYSRISGEVIRAGSEERRANPRSTSAKLRWAERAAA